MNLFSNFLIEIFAEYYIYIFMIFSKLKFCLNILMNILPASI